MADGVEAGRSLGRYVVEAPIGAGGFATVYRARDAGLDRPVALKVLDPLAHRNPTTARRFVNEGRAAASLDHPAIVPVYDAGETDGLSWLAMRLVVGESLAEAIERGRRFDDAEIDALLSRIGPALDHAHAQGVVHRDVKPSNILLESGDPARAWLADFGIAATARTAGRYTTGTLGTAAYMAPEQARPSEVGPAADVYSLGCVAYELVVGRRPFPGDDHVALLVAHATSPVPATGDPALDAALGRALAKGPVDRPPSGAALAFELRAALAAASTSGPRTIVAAPVPAPGDAATLVSFAAATTVPPGPAAASPAAGVPSRRPPLPPPPPPLLRTAPAAPPTVPHAPTAAYPHAPTAAPAAAGRGAARWMLLAGAIALAGVAGAVAVTVAGDDGGGTRHCEEDVDVCFDLPSGWSVADVERGNVTLAAGGRPVAAYTNGPTDADEPVAALDDAGVCRDAAGAAPVGDADGARCETVDGGTAALVVDGGIRWLVTVAADAPAAEADAFVGSFTFG
jgi:serine/threonine-protein kinase